MLQYLWKTSSGNTAVSNSDKAVILVGNKADLVRTRSVSIVDAKAVASSYDCKYTETSGELNHNVDELLVGILKQIRLKLAEKVRYSSGGGRRRKFAGALSLYHPGKSNKDQIRRKSAGIKVR